MDTDSTVSPQEAADARKATFEEKLKGLLDEEKFHLLNLKN